MNNPTIKDAPTQKSTCPDIISAPPLFAIGEMAKRCSTTPKTLKHYEKLGLFKPAKICRETGYRYYSAEQINFFVAIQGMRINNFSLDDIKNFLTNPGPENLLSAYNKKISLITTEMTLLENAKKRLELRRDLLTQALELKEKISPTTDFKIKTYSPRPMLTTPCQGKINAAAIGSAFAENINFSKKNNLGIFEHLLLLYPPLSNLQSPGYYYEAANMLSKASTFSSSRVKELEEGDYVCFYHLGKLEKTGPQFNQLEKWLRANKLKKEGPLIVFYLISYAHTLSYNDNLCELQYKVSPL